MSGEEAATGEAETMWQGRYIAARRDGPWEYVTRTRGIGAVVIIAIQDGHVLLVEQYRVPLGRYCLELPAGLIGDEDESERDPLEVARRELEEETGWRPGRVTLLGEFASSPGMVGETFTLVRADDLIRVSEGGGVAGENIVVHRVPLADAGSHVAKLRAAGCVIDVKLLLLLAGEMLSAPSA